MAIPAVFGAKLCLVVSRGGWKNSCASQPERKLVPGSRPSPHSIHARMIAQANKAVYSNGSLLHPLRSSKSLARCQTHCLPLRQDDGKRF